MWPLLQSSTHGILKMFRLWTFDKHIKRYGMFNIFNIFVYKSGTLFNNRKFQYLNFFIYLILDQFQG